MSDDILESLLELKSAMISLRHDAERGLSIPTLPRLRAVVAGLGQGKPAPTITCPEEHRIAWKRVLSGAQPHLLSRSIRFLAWEPTVVLDPRFHAYLEKNGLVLGARGIQGLVRACHLGWTHLSNQRNVLLDAATKLQEYRGPNRIVGRWQRDTALVLHPDAAPKLASWMFSGRRSPEETAKDWGFDGTSAFLLEATKSLLTMARAKWADDHNLARFVCDKLLGWNAWSIEQFKLAVAEAILDPSANANQIIDPLKTFILSHPALGDPRLPANRTFWLGVPIQARQRLIEWLSKADIIFFFHHAFPKGGDRHLRKPFWLNYVSRVKTSRPLLCKQDEYSLTSTQQERDGEIGNFGRIIGSNSVFLLSFGDIWAIEFNKIGACYLYEHRNLVKFIPDIFSQGYFIEKDLRQRGLYAARIIHKPGWQDDLQQELARLGVRPQK